MRSVRHRDEEGALSAALLVFSVLTLGGIFFFLQVAHANVLATESRTAADAAALAAAEHLRSDVPFGNSDSPCSSQAGAAQAARDYAQRNNARVTECTVHAAFPRGQYAVSVTTEGLEGPTDGPSDELTEMRPTSRSRAEATIELDLTDVSDGTLFRGQQPRLAPMGGSDDWKSAGTVNWGSLVGGGARPPGPPGEMGYGWPLCAPVTSEFGPRRHPIYNDVRMHTGMDQGAATGTPVHASKEGTVARAGTAGGYGNLVTIRHEDGVETYYAHLSAIGVSVGDEVDVGDPIGAVGSTGNSTGPHLHFETRVGGQPIDPRGFLEGAPCS